jgi:hypothetical protein
MVGESRRFYIEQEHDNLILSKSTNQTPTAKNTKQENATKTHAEPHIQDDSSSCVLSYFALCPPFLIFSFLDPLTIFFLSKKKGRVATLRAEVGVGKKGGKRDGRGQVS